MSEGLERRLVAVMFTDMAGYTALMQTDEQQAVAQRDLYMAAVERHHEAFGGRVVQRLGDGSFGMFPSALAAVQAAVAIQREVGGVPVRIGIHVGEVVVEAERLTGDPVNVAARIESFAVPGSILLSDTAYDQVKNRADVAVAPLGSFRLKNVGRPVELHAVALDGLVVPPRETLEGKGERLVAVRSSLPEPAAGLIGREADLATLVELTRAHRLVTITGPGGVGKTRLLVELGRALAAEFPDGVVFAGLSDVDDPADFLPALASALDVREAEGRTAIDGLVALIGDRKVLLALDNLEQIVDAATDIAALQGRCAGLRVVATSRTPLHLAAERTYALEPLPISTAVALFVERAQPFELTVEHEAAVLGICERLDGLPLALELAAARLRLLDPTTLLARLEHALDLLRSGNRDVHERQQTLRAAIGWSWSLLDGPAQDAFRRLAVFADGCTLADAEAVTGAGLDELESLVDNALVKVERTGRLRLLQTIHDYAREQLDASGEAATLAASHAWRFAVVAREIRDAVEGEGQRAAVERGTAEEANLQAALETLLALARTGDAAAGEAGLQMTGDLWMYWHIRGKNLTARDYAAAFLALAPGAGPTPGRAGALVTSGLASWISGELERADAEWSEALSIAEALGAERELCVAGLGRSLALMGLNPATGLECAQAAAERARAVGYAWGEGFAGTFAGLLHIIRGEERDAERSLSGALDIQNRLGDDEGAGLSLGGLAQLAARRGDHAAAVDLYRRSLASFEAIRDRAEEARILSELGWSHLAREDVPAAREAFRDAARRYDDVASVRGIGLALIGLAAAAAVRERYELAAQLAAAAEVYAHDEGIVNVYAEETPGRRYVDRARAELSAAALERADAAGRCLSITEALELG